MIASALLLDHVTEELHREANVLQEGRNMREVRLASRGGGKENLAASSRQSTIDKRSNEIKKFRSGQGAHHRQGSWTPGATSSS